MTIYKNAASRDAVEEEKQAADGKKSPEVVTRRHETRQKCKAKMVAHDDGETNTFTGQTDIDDDSAPDSRRLTVVKPNAYPIEYSPRISAEKKLSPELPSGTDCVEDSQCSQVQRHHCLRAQSSRVGWQAGPCVELYYNRL